MNPYRGLGMRAARPDGSAVRYMRPQQAATITEGYIAALRFMANTIGEKPCLGDVGELQQVVDGANVWLDHMADLDDWKADLEMEIVDAEELLRTMGGGR